MYSRLLLSFSISSQLTKVEIVLRSHNSNSPFGLSPSFALFAPVDAVLFNFFAVAAAAFALRSASATNSSSVGCSYTYWEPIGHTANNSTTNSNRWIKHLNLCWNVSHAVRRVSSRVARSRASQFISFLLHVTRRNLKTLYCHQKDPATVTTRDSAARVERNAPSSQSPQLSRYRSYKRNLYDSRLIASSARRHNSALLLPPQSIR
jgi:hypothetical protein